MKRLVVDAGPLLHLTEANALYLLPLAGKVHAPKQVIAEVAFHSSQWQTPDWIILNALEAMSAAAAITWQRSGLLDAGEAEAIALAQQIQADWLLTDDAAARLFAVELGLEAHGSLGLILWAAAVGHLSRDEADQALTRLAASSLWVSNRVLNEARLVLEKMF